MGEVCMRGWLYRLWEGFDGSMAEFVEAYL